MKTTEAESATSSSDIKKLAQLIKGIRVAMLTTFDTDGCLYSRPMAAQEIEFDGDLWFFTSRSSPKVEALNNEHHLNLSYANPSDSRYVSISGTAEIIEDKDKAQELWNPLLKAWFPKGVDDPDLILLKVKPESAEYWDAPSAKMVKLFSLARAAITGKTYPKLGENKKIDLHH